MRVVIDTNLWLSGLMLPTSAPGLLVRAVVAGEIVAVTIEPLLQEIGAALHYPKVRKRIALTDEQLRRFLTELRYVMEVFDIASVVAEVPKDRRGEFILATSIASGPDYLVRGDSDLADLRAQFAILTAREFCHQHLR